MPDRVHYHPNLIYTLGTQVVALVEILGQNGKVLHPRGSVGVVIRTPTDLEHPYRVRFPDGVEESLNRDQLTMLRSIFLSRMVYQTYNGYVLSQF